MTIGEFRNSRGGRTPSVPIPPCLIPTAEIYFGLRDGAIQAGFSLPPYEGGDGHRGRVRGRIPSWQWFGFAWQLGS
jgi:hypothetical protein